MGMYDSFMVDGVEYQSKAFGKLLKEYYPGDGVKVSRAPFTTDECNASLSGMFKREENSYSTYQVECSSKSGLYLQVTDNIFTGVGDRDETIPLFDYYGRLTDVP